MATRNAVFIDRYVREQVAIGSKGDLVRLLKTRFRSHVGVGSLDWGKRFAMPLQILLVVGWEKTDYPFIY